MVYAIMVRGYTVWDKKGKYNLEEIIIKWNVIIKNHRNQFLYFYMEIKPKDEQKIIFNVLHLNINTVTPHR